ncbi:hypothetical protein RB595_003996 [Gaeumannomyces hyphopodioides]
MRGAILSSCLASALLAAVGQAAVIPVGVEPASPATPVLVERAQVAVALGPSATVVGATTGKFESFKGIPYADAPVGNLRFRPPQRLSKPLGTYDATTLIPNSCPQMTLSTESGGLVSEVLGRILTHPFLQTVTKVSEDCLSINVQRPAGIEAGDKLPVLFWIYGGGFQVGSTAMYDGTALLRSGLDINQPFVFVAVNFRGGAFGFLPGAEILAEGSSNAGLLDQRMGLEWVADNIAAFGGDPDKVTIWGESSGAISVFDQMALYGGNITYKGKSLFRGAIMNSGSLAPAHPIDCPKGKKVYSTVVSAAGCAGSGDTLACLRSLPFEKLLPAVHAVPSIFSYNSLSLSYLPRPDGKVLPKSPDQLLAAGQYAAVPMIIGNQEDEGTFFSIFQSDITTTERLIQYLGSLYFQNATRETLGALVATYDPFVSSGSPFRTGVLWELYPGFKRMAAILGDIVFTLTRRTFLTAANHVNPSVPSWSYLSSYDYGTPFLGTFHASDVLQVFYGIPPNYASRATMAYYTNFLYNLDPNNGVSGYMNWPRWSEGQRLMNFFALHARLIGDDFRSDSAASITANSASLYE